MSRLTEVMSPGKEVLSVSDVGLVKTKSLSSDANLGLT